MKIEGTFQGMDPIQSGVSQAGNPWQKTYFEIITNEGERSRRVVFLAFGNVVEQVKAVPKGATVEVRFSAESTDYLDKNNRKRYDTELRCYGLAVITRQSMQPPYIYAPQPAQQYMQPLTPSSGYPPAPPVQETAVPQYQQQPASSADELPPKNYGLPC